MFTRKKDPDPKPPFSKDPLSEAFSKSSVLGPERHKFKKLRIRADMTVSMYPGSKSSVFEKTRGGRSTISSTCARSLSCHSGATDDALKTKLSLTVPRVCLLVDRVAIKQLLGKRIA